jgi:acetyl-CoA acetyltransferase
VVCFRALNGYAETRYGRAERSLGQSHGPVVASGDRSPSGAFAGPYGLLAPGQVMASWAHRYCYQYGLTVDQLKTALGRIAIDQRQYAHTNPAALMKDKPLDFATYLRARPIADPLGLFDFALETDGAAAVVVAAADIARGSKRTAWVRGAIQGLLPFAESVSIYGDLRNAPAYRRIGARLFQQAGLTPSDISVAMLYDATTVTTLLAMETFGLAPEGQAWRVLTDQGLGPSCPLPINTNGGHLSEAYIHGLNLVVEAARQCWGTSPNQIADVKAVLCTSGPTGLILSPE